LKLGNYASRFFARKINFTSEDLANDDAMPVVHVTQKHKKLYSENETREHFNTAGLPKKERQSERGSQSMDTKCADDSESTTSGETSKWSAQHD
jgi:hypothetical protein